MITTDVSARSSKRIDFLTIVCVLALLALPLIIFWPVTLGKQVWVGGDSSTFSYPLFVLNSQQWLQGHVPLWNPYLYGGTPALATQEGGAFYPLNLILWLTLPPALALSYATLIHLGLTGLSVFCLLRSLRCSRRPLFWARSLFSLAVSRCRTWDIWSFSALCPGSASRWSATISGSDLDGGSGSPVLQLRSDSCA